jgi:hypothetical protein
MTVCVLTRVMICVCACTGTDLGLHVANLNSFAFLSFAHPPSPILCRPSSVARLPLPLLCFSFFVAFHPRHIICYSLSMYLLLLPAAIGNIKLKHHRSVNTVDSGSQTTMHTAGATKVRALPFRPVATVLIFSSTCQTACSLC